MSAVESILTLDRLRQSVAVKELLQAKGQSLMRKTASVPNFTQLLSRLDSNSLSDFGVCRSESVSELCRPPPGEKQNGIGMLNISTFPSYDPVKEKRKRDDSTVFNNSRLLVS